jgi:hypothetical protein
MLFGTSNNPMCHIFLILSYVYILCLNHISLSCYFFLASVQSLSHRQCLYHIQHIITNAICQWLTPQQPNKTTPPMVSQRLHPSAPLLPPCHQPLPSLAAHCSLLAAQSSRHLVSNPASINTPPTVQTK